MQKSPFGFCQVMHLYRHSWKRTITKTLLVMKLTILLLTVVLLTAHAEEGRAQQVTMSGKEIPLKQVFAVIKKQTGYVTLHNKELLAKAKDVSLSVKNMPLQDLLDIVFREQPLKYVIEGKTIVVSSKPQLTENAPMRLEISQPAKDTVTVNGKVVDENNEPVAGANIVVARTRQGIATDKNGEFSVKVRLDDLLEITFIGFEKYLYRVKSNARVLINLKKSETSIKEVIVTGLVDRKQTSFTGAAVTYTQKELLQAGNKNVLQSLKNMDPSFRVMENLTLGSDPNRLPEIQMRGQSSLPNLQGDYSGNPNQPLFILDGFETTLQRVFDLNMNRIASVTLLKDAAAKAIYGSRAANGVVVIETIRPAKGKLRVSYTGEAAVEAPDLSGYNLMEAADKLAFEKERGIYRRFVYSPGDVQERDLIYQANYNNVLRGVNTYWLSQPLQTGLTTRHALNLEGGDNSMRYQAGITYNKIAGVMKGSGRNTMALFTTLSYTYRNLIFRNQLEYNRNVSTNSPYGSFADYTKLNQYYSPYDENGNLVKVMGTFPFNNGGTDQNVYNPLYNATLNVKSESGYSQLINNFYIDWRISSTVRATGSVSYSRSEIGSDNFLPPSHTNFINYDANGMSDRKGMYTKDDGYNQSIISNIGINYNKMIGGHQILANATWNLNTRRDMNTTVIAEGFGNDEVDNISFATRYAQNTKPQGSDSRVREIGFVGILGYSFEDRFLFDASIRSSGSSMFGADNRWGAFWSVGAGWNLHKERFMSNNSWINQMRFRTSYGYTGAQNFNPFQGRARYNFGNIVYNNGLGAELIGLPNSSLKWQKKMDFNAGFDLAVKRFLTLRLDYSRGITTDLLVDMTIPPSMGFSTYKDNVGEISNTGYEFSLALTPWRNDHKRAWVTVNFTGAHFENKLRKVYDIFTTWNQKQDADKNVQPGTEGFNRDAYRSPAVYLIEGQSMDAIWGVRSLGIDPLTGEEMFRDRFGNNTFQWSTADQTIIGDKNPKLNGTLGLNAGYNGFSLSVACTYRYGGYLYNSTLIERIENISGMDNLDKRILESWRKPGDIAQYRVLTLSAGTTDIHTRPTSRFVQKDNELYVSSLNVAYDFTGQRWLKKSGMDNLRLAFYMNELVRLSSVQIERGREYPFARNFSFQVQATF